MEDNLQNVAVPEGEVMPTPLDEAPKKKAKKARGKKRFSKKLIWALVILVVLAVGFFYIRGLSGAGSVEAEGTTAVASYQDVSVVLSGTGTIEAKDKYDIIAMATGDVLAADFEEGDLVTEGQVLYKIDTKEYNNSLERAQNSVEKAQLSYDDLKEDLASLNVKSDYTGVVTNLYVKKGDSVQNGAKIADVVDDSKLVLTVPFIASDADRLYVGMNADVTLENSFYSVTGTVRHVATGSTVGENNIATSEVEIVVENPGGIRVGDRATAIAGGVACNNLGSFEAYDSGTITAKTAGDIEVLSISKGDKVYGGQVVANLSSSNLDQQLKQSELSVKDANLSLEGVQDTFENYHITAPISGTVVQKTIKAGDTLDNSNTRVTMAVIADLSSVTFTLNVDELDIAKVAVGQTVDIVADAYPDDVYKGVVDNISLSGTTQNGVTVYPVKVVIDEPGDLMMGMNVTAEVVVESKENVLTVPIGAVNRGNVVYVQGEANARNNEQADEGAESSRGQRPDGARSGETDAERPAGETSGTPSGIPSGRTGNASASRASSAPEGFYEVRVEVGINDDNNVEIISGLNEGDVVYVPYQSSSQSGLMMMGGGMMGGGMPSGGGMPGGGGMPSGGGPQGGGMR